MGSIHTYLLGVELRLDLRWSTQFDKIYASLVKKCNQLERSPASEPQLLEMTKSLVTPALAYSVPPGIYNEKQLAKFASLITSSTKKYGGLPVSTMTLWATLDRKLAGLGGVDLMEIASTR